MQTFVVLSALVAVAVASPGFFGYHAPAPIGHDGRVVDTPEVAHAKEAHLAAHASEAARNYGHGYAPALAYHSAYPSHGYAHPGAPLAADGRVIDTPEVAHAKAAHFAAHAHESAKTGGGHEYEGHAYGGPSYIHAPVYAYAHGPPAPLGHDGRVIDTPEVAHAKAAHLAAHHAAGAHY